MIGSVLVANRGEIALRVVRTCRELGIRSVVAYSTADRDSAAVRAADESVLIGPPPAKLSYLNVPAVIEAALRHKVDAIHPGYGFLSEDPDFAEVCEANDLVFVGPPASVLAELGDKARAKARMAEAGLPVLPGSLRALDNRAEVKELVDRIGFPVVIKAAAGGGGRGITVVTEPRELMRAYGETRALAQAVFGDNRVYLERYLPATRHVEVQVLCDAYGNGVHLGERDCSVQRRHQKLIEETPAPGLPERTIDAMTADALRGALAAGYVGAGTLELLVDQDGRHYFMEINCRIQVEHPVTEMVTGLDLVREQLLVASGRPLSITQEQVERRGVAVECRVNAEDPARNFAPAPGRLTTFVPPGGPGIRVDTHGYEGWTVGGDYDSLLAKVIAWAPDRERALARMDRALAEFRVAGPGVRTTVDFLREVVTSPVFTAAKHTTMLLDEMRPGG